MLEFKQLSLEDKNTFDRYSKSWNSDSSDMSFANMYTWACSENTQFAVEDDTLYLMQRIDETKVRMRMPLPFDTSADLSAQIEKAKGFCYENGFSMHLNIPSVEMLKKFLETTGNQYKITPCKGNFDYVYLSSDLIELSGNKFHAKRNHINKFLSLYEPEFEIYNDSFYQECIELYNKWYFSQGMGSKDINKEKCSIERTLSEYKELDLKGCVIKVQGKVCAFSFGEMINEDTALILVEKYNPEFDGIGAYINKTFVERCWAHAKFINREEDMGIEGLRRSKKSYNPIKMLKKYAVMNMVD